MNPFGVCMYRANTRDETSRGKKESRRKQRGKEGMIETWVRVEKKSVQ